MKNVECRMKNENYSANEECKIHSSFYIPHSSFIIFASKRSDQKVFLSVQAKKICENLEGMQKNTTFALAFGKGKTRRFRLAARTHASHAWNTGSIPVGATKKGVRLNSFFIFHEKLSVVFSPFQFFLKNDTISHWAVGFGETICFILDAEHHHILTACVFQRTFAIRSHSDDASF